MSSLSTQITDYSEWIEWNWRDGIDKNVPLPFNKYNTPSISGIEEEKVLEISKTIGPFSRNLGGKVKLSECPYCSWPLGSIEGDVKLLGDSQRDGILTSIKADRIICGGCGWWFVQKSKTVDWIISQNIEYFETVYEGVLKRFDLDSIQLPLVTLKDHLEKSRDDIHLINPHVFERLVADVFRDFYDCEVKHVGGPNDGGVDVFAVIGDNPCLIQAKRRSSPNKKESVKTVRELIGTLIGIGVDNGFVVTTASDFSKASKELASNQNLVRHDININLVNKDDFFNMLNIAQTKVEKIWEILTKKWLTTG